MRASRLKVTQWAEKLTDDQKVILITDLVRCMMESEDVCFYDDNLSPYWESSGDPLVEGQQTHDEE